MYFCISTVCIQQCGLALLTYMLAFSFAVAQQHIAKYGLTLCSQTDNRMVRKINVSPTIINPPTCTR